MKVFHGTTLSSANAMIGPPSAIDVSRGRGELGQGFYTGENVALAAAWAKGRYGRNAAVIKIKIDDSDYFSLNTKVLQRRQVVYRLWQSLIKRNRTHTHRFNVDVVIAPFSTLDFSYQYKFESAQSEKLLNFSVKQIL